MSKRLDWLYDPKAIQKSKTELELMNEAVDLEAVETEKPAKSDVLDLKNRMREDPLFKIKKREIQKKAATRVPGNLRPKLKK